MKEKVKQPIIVLTGPTASGKTSLSLDLAKEFGGEIICADSMTVYKGMDIGTDKPTSVIPVEAGIQKKIDSGQARMTIQGVPHHMLDILNPDEEFNVAIFKGLAEGKIKEIHSRDNIPFIVGGSTMYIDALVYKYDIPHTKPNNNLRKELDKKSNEELFAQLIELDPDAQVAVDRNNKRRLVRALEVCLQTGEPFTAQKKKQDLPKNVLYLAIGNFTGEMSENTPSSSVIPAEAGIQSDTYTDARFLNLENRQRLYQKINQRVDEMMKEGFLNEVKKLHKKNDLNTAMQATGYKQLVEFLDGNLTLDEAVEKTKQSHRNYAKRQLTWLNRNKDVIWIKSKQEAEESIINFLSA